jgi:uncharacterized protein YfaS (alpha-2-macroglobulin family)
VVRQQVAADGVLQLGADLIEGLYPDTVEGALRVSPRPPLGLRSALKNLLQYPYGCLEQTTSRAYPLLFADSHGTHRLGLEPIDEGKRLEWITKGVERVRAMQLRNGGFGLWDENSDEEPWLTPYVVDFLLDARERGHHVPDDVLQAALERLQRRLRSATVSTSRFSRDPKHLAFASQAYGAYVLSRVGQAPLGSLRTLYDKQRSHGASGLPLTHLGLALLRQGDQRRGKAALATAADMTRGDDYLGDYGSPVRDLALMVRLLADRETHDEIVGSLVFRLRDALAGKRWLSTQEQAALFLAGQALGSPPGEPWRATWSIGDQELELDQDGLWHWTVDPQALDAGASLANTTESPLYASLVLSGYPRQAPEPVQDPVSIARTWYTPDGELLTSRHLRVGDLVVVRLHLTSTELIEHGLVVDLLPAGLEVENANLSRGEGLGGLSIEGKTLQSRQAKTRHLEFRDDRYVAALSLERGRAADLFYLARAVTPGTYRLPPPYMEDMYRPAIRGIGDSAPEMVVEP